MWNRERANGTGDGAKPGGNKGRANNVQTAWQSVPTLILFDLSRLLLNALGRGLWICLEFYPV